MKQLKLLFSCSLFSLASLQAQQSFTLTPNPVYGVADGTISVVGEAMVKNLAATTNTFRWTRTVIRLENDSLCFTNVADPYIDWIYFASEKTFALAPGQEGPLNVTLWDLYETGCCAIIQMKLKKLDLPIDSIVATYYFRTCPSLSISEAQKSAVQIFPNPAAQFFSLKNAGSVSRLTLCDASGRMLKKMPFSTENRYEVASLLPGTYYLVLENKEGAIMQVLEFVKG